MKQKRARREAARFLWHLQDARFDHEHWWSGKEEGVRVEAAVWEIIRRHPNAERVYQKRNLTGLNRLGIFLKAVKDWRHRTPRGFFSWSKLTAPERNNFKKRIWEHLPSQHGYVVPPVTVLNDFRPLMRHLKSKRSSKKFMALQEPHLCHRLCDETVLAHRSGQIIVAIDPGAQYWRIEKSLKSAVADWRGEVKPPAGEKDRTGQRLKIIASFERKKLDGTFSKNSSEAQLLTRYRRTIANFPLPLA